MAKNKGVLYISTHTLQVQTDKTVLATFSFPQDLVKNGEILDNEAFTQFITERLAEISKKVGNVIIVIGSDLLYQRSVAKDEDASARNKELLESLPFAKESVAQKTITTASKTYLLATNKSFYEAVSHAASENDLLVEAVLPLSLFTDTDAGEELPKEIVETIITKESLYDVGNFITEQVSVESDEPESVEVEEERPTSTSAFTPETVYGKHTVWNTSRLVLILGFLIVLTGLLGGLIYLQHNHVRILPTAEVTPTPMATPSPTPTPTETAKDELKVKVENGTGQAGQAGKVQSLVEGIGYSAVETGNADNTDHDKTEILFSDKVSAAQQKELKDLLLETFTAVTTSVGSSSTVDIDIITGQEK